jgi:hypothetical protein
MARWFAIVALLLGMGFTAFDSFSASTVHEPRVRIMEGGHPWPPPPDRLTDGGTDTQTPGGLK